MVCVVLDTNVLISACLKPAGLEAGVLERALEGNIVVCVTPEVWAEYRDVLFREKFAFARARAEALLEALARRIRHVTAGSRISACSDEDDNRFLECAAAAGAAYLITGNLRHYPSEWGSTRIVNARGFVETVQPGL